jgi:hypothetical protein
MEKALTYMQTSPSPDLIPPGPGIASVLVGFDPKVYHRKTAKVQTANVTD